MTTNEGMTTLQALTLAMSTGRSEFVRALVVGDMTPEDVTTLRDLLADQIDHNATNYIRYQHLDAQARMVVSALYKATVQEVAKLVAIASPNVECDVGKGSENIRAAMEDVISEWHEAGVFTMDIEDFHKLMDLVSGRAVGHVN